jgi:hypothetical protein
MALVFIYMLSIHYCCEYTYYQQLIYISIFDTLLFVFDWNFIFDTFFRF